MCNFLPLLILAFSVGGNDEAGFSSSSIDSLNRKFIQINILDELWYLKTEMSELYKPAFPTLKDYRQDDDANYDASKPKPKLHDIEVICG